MLTWVSVHQQENTALCKDIFFFIAELAAVTLQLDVIKPLLRERVGLGLGLGAGTAMENI